MSVGHQIDQHRVDTLVKGKSTKADVRAAIGAPDNISKDLSGQESWIYSYSRSTVKGTTFIPYIGGLVGGSNTQTQQVVVVFGADGTVENVTSTYGGTEANANLTAGGKPKMADVDDGKRK